MCQDLVDEWVLVSEDEISYAVYKMLQEHSKVQHFFISKSKSGLLPAIVLKEEEGGGFQAAFAKKVGEQSFSCQPKPLVDKQLLGFKMDFFQMKVWHPLPHKNTHHANTMIKIEGIRRTNMHMLRPKVRIKFKPSKTITV